VCVCVCVCVHVHMHTPLGWKVVCGDRRDKSIRVRTILISVALYTLESQV
jgi:hypothetical protein